MNNILKPKTHCLKSLILAIMLLASQHIFANNNINLDYANLTKLSLSIDNGSIIDLFKEVEKQSEFVFIYNSNVINSDTKVSVECSDEIIQNVLNSALVSTPYTYSINDRQVVITSKTEVAKSTAKEQQRKVAGKVVDESNAPIAGALIEVLGTTTGAISDMNGDFTVNALASDSLRVTFVGYMTVLTSATNQTQKITLEVDALDIEEVVVVGFGTQKKVNLTGSVSVVDQEVFESRPVISATQALEGSVPGLNMTRSSGGLGETAAINIRGVGTIDGGSSGDPLILIDGMEGDINTLNPQDIASVSVLKDAASSSIYGSRAPFGVILITTKKGKAGKMTINYNNSFRYSTQSRLPEMMDSYEVALFLRDCHINSGQTTDITDEYLDRIITYRDNPGSIPTTIADKNIWKSGHQGANANMDWMDNVYKDWAFGQEHNFSVSGGTEKAQVYASVNYLNQRGFSNYNKDTYRRFSSNLRVTGEVFKGLKYNYNFKYQETKQQEPRELSSFNPSNYLTEALVPMYDPNGHLVNNWANLLTNAGTESTSTRRLYQQFQIVATPLKNWNITGEFNYKVQSVRDHEDAQSVWVYTVDNQPYLNSQSNTYVSEKSVSQSYLNPNIFTDYSYSINDTHNFKIMAGFQSEKNIVNNFSASRNGIIIPGSQTIDMTDGTDISGKASPSVVSGAINDWATAGFFGRFNYDFDGRYLFEANVRYDGTSRFISSQRWGFFPSASVGWNIAKEGFWEPMSDKISNLKLRASYGELGNQNTTNLYPSFSKVGLSTATNYWLVNGAAQNAATPPALLDIYMTWETIKSANIGVDVTAFKNRLNVSLDYFDRKTTDMVGPAQEAPEILGVAVPKTNNTDLTNRGWELSTRWNDRTASGFGYSVGFNISDSQTTIDSYPNDKGVLLFKNSKGTVYNNGRSDMYVTGQKLGEIWGYTTIGIAKSDAEMTEHLATLPNGGQTMIMGGADAKLWKAGDVMYKDLNNDGKIASGAGTIYDSGDMSIIGNSTPRYTFGANLSASYKGFDFSAFMQGTMKRDFATNSVLFYGFSEASWAISTFNVLGDYFRGEEDHPLGQNLNPYYPRPLTNKKNSQIQSKYLLDASYLRVKNVQLGYTFNNLKLSNVNISNLRIFASAENLFTFTSLPEMFDPETIDGYNYGVNYPMQSTISFGLNVSF